MVCDRCIWVVNQQLEQLNFKVTSISLGSVEIEPAPSDNQVAEIASALQISGFELIDNEKDKLIELIKNSVIETIHYSDLSEVQINIPTLLTNKINKDYGYLSRLFSENEGITIEKFIIQQKVEKVKELLQDGQLNINEIAWKMGYSSSAHLSSQFKSIAGLSPTAYKTLEIKNRKPLDAV